VYMVVNTRARGS